MTIVNKLAMPLVMTHGFKNSNPNQKEIDNVFKTIAWFGCDDGEERTAQIETQGDDNLEVMAPTFKQMIEEYSSWSGPNQRWLDDLEHSSTKYFYIEIFHPNSFMIFPLADLVGSHLEKIQSGEIHLVIHNVFHGYHSTPEHIYTDIIIKYGIDPKNITVQSESRDMFEALQISAYKYSLPKFNLEWVRKMEYRQQQQVLHDNNWAGLNCETLVHKEYEKKFVSYNGRWRPHRGLLIALLSSNNLLDKGYISFNIRLGMIGRILGTDNYDLLTHAFGYDESLMAMLHENQSMIENIDQILLEEDQVMECLQVNSTDIDYYTNTYFSVVTETQFPDYRLNHDYDQTEVGRILSEKIFKPIAMKHPFIIVTNPLALELLREIGYKTFHGLIDETYDKVTDPATRMIMILNEIKKLCALEGDELRHFLTEAKKICDYNYNVLLSQREFKVKLIS